MALEATKEMEAQVCLETCASGSTAAAMNLETAFLNNCENGLSEWMFQYSFPVLEGKQAVVLAWEESFQRIRSAIAKAPSTKRVTCHSFLHSFATHLIEDGCDIGTVEQLFGHNHIKITMIYTHVPKRRHRPCAALRRAFDSKQSGRSYANPYKTP